jgi:hypothetical protein
MKTLIGFSQRARICHYKLWMEPLPIPDVVGLAKWPFSRLPRKKETHLRYRPMQTDVFGGKHMFTPIGEIAMIYVDNS